MAEPARTRRSSRTSATPVQATSETPGVSRAELRRQAAAAVQTQLLSAFEAAPAAVPAVIDTPAAPAVVDEAPAAAAPAADAPVAGFSRRARRTPRTAEVPVESTPVDADADPSETETVEVLEVDTEPVTAEMVPVAETSVEGVEAAESPVAEPAPAAAAPTVERPTRRIRAPRRPLVDAEPAEQAAATPVVETLIMDEPVEAEAPVDETPVAETSVADEPVAEASDVDEFEAAARLFSFTGEVPVQEADAQADSADADGDAAPANHKAPRKARVSRGVAFKRVTAASFSVGVMGIVGLMTVGMTTPAEAVAAASGTDAAISILAPGDVEGTEIDADEIQAYVAPASVEAETLDRSGNYDTTTVAELASQAGIQNFSNLFHNDPNAAIQWPFAVGVTMSYGFGMRSGRMHEGIDFTPGAGSPIQAIADGTVRVASEAGGAYGVHVIIDHMIDGQLVSSHYAHMQYGSLQVVPGQQVTVGTVLGRTGNTGRSYGAHTHFEILMNGTSAIDPMPWLREHAGG